VRRGAQPSRADAVVPASHGRATGGDACASEPWPRPRADDDADGEPLRRRDDGDDADAGPWQRPRGPSPGDGVDGWGPLQRRHVDDGGGAELAQ